MEINKVASATANILGNTVEFAASEAISFFDLGTVTGTIDDFYKTALKVAQESVKVCSSMAKRIKEFYADNELATHAVNFTVRMSGRNGYKHDFVTKAGNYKDFAAELRRQSEKFVPDRFVKEQLGIQQETPMVADIYDCAMSLQDEFQLIMDNLVEKYGFDDYDKKVDLKGIGAEKVGDEWKLTIQDGYLSKDVTFKSDKFCDVLNSINEVYLDIDVDKEVYEFFGVDCKDMPKNIGALIQDAMEIDAKYENLLYEVEKDITPDISKDKTQEWKPKNEKQKEKNQELNR